VSTVTQLRPRRGRRALPEYQPGGTVGVIAQDTARFSMFAASVTSLQVPAGTRIDWVLGNDITEGCNRLIRGDGEQGVGIEGDWFWLLGDDHAFPPFTLMNLLAHDVDIVVPLCLTRQPPFEPVIFSGWLDEDRSLRRRVRLDDHPDGGLVEIHSGGSAGMLVRRHVLEALEDPWFRKYPVDGRYFAEDLYFCDLAREAGFKLYCDLDTKFGHITSSIVWPQKLAEGWSFGFGFPQGFMLTMPHGTWVDPDGEGE
jgi:hypothetical protein